jgi:ketosteroid isomerase-like protein
LPGADPLAGDTPWTTSEETVAILRRGYAAFNRGDTSVVLELATEIATPDVEWGATGAFPGLESTYRGPEAMREWMDVIRSAWEQFEVTLDEVPYDGNDVVVVTGLVRGRRREGGAEVEMRIFSVYRFEQGKLRRREAFTDRNAALEAAGLSE